MGTKPFRVFVFRTVFGLVKETMATADVEFFGAVAAVLLVLARTYAQLRVWIALIWTRGVSKFSHQGHRFRALY